MRSSYFFDYRILPPKEEDPIPFWQIQQFAFKKFHGAISRHGLGQVALAFPNYCQESIGDIFRVFAAERGLLDTVALEFFKDARTRGYGHLGAIQDVGQASGWVAFKRIRPFSKRSFSKLGVFPELRERLMAKVRACPSINMSSSVNGSPFMITVAKVILATPEAAGTPDGYGLSRSKQVVPLPTW